MIAVKYEDGGPAAYIKLCRGQHISSADLCFFEGIGAKIIISNYDGFFTTTAAVPGRDGGQRMLFSVTGIGIERFSALREQIEEWLDPTTPAIDGCTIITLTADMINALHEDNLLCGDYDVTITESHGKLYAYRTEWPEDCPTYLGEV